MSPIFSLQRFKRTIGHRAVSRPEVHFAQQLLLGQAMEKIFKTGTVVALHQVIARESRDYTKPCYDTAENGVLLLGVGRPISRDEPESVDEVLEVRSGASKIAGT